MSGVTNSAFRKLIHLENPGSVGLVVTEFISIEGLTRQNLRSLEMMRFEESERPISIQIFGHDVERMILSAQMIQDAGADIIDINSGCPVPKVVRRGGGCELMRQPDHMKVLLERVVKAVSIPVTLKIRSGWDEQTKNALQIAKIAEDAGIAMLAVHGRTRSALYRGEADWEVVEQVARSIKIPVVGSGDIVDYQSYKKLRTPNVAGVMIGRGALENPWIFSSIHAQRGREDTECADPAAPEILRVIRRYSALLSEHLPDKAVLGKLKQFCSQVTRMVRGSTPVRKALCQSKDMSEFTQVLQRWEDSLYSAGHCSGDRSTIRDSAAHALGAT
jgi:tRNA-dihydrouridine synthase B